MKSFWKKHWKWIVPTLVAATALIVALSLYFLGFRITYDPTIITNWDAVSGCASWVGVVVSVAAVVASIVAIFYAIRVPKEIANRQDQIAIFEKRLTCYSDIQQLMSCSELMKKCTVPTQIFQSFCSVYGFLNSNVLEAVHQLVQIFNIKQIVVTSGKFIFSKYDSDDAQELFHAAGDLLQSLVDHPNRAPDGNLPVALKEKRDIFCKKCDDFAEKYLDAMEEELNLK